MFKYFYILRRPVETTLPWRQFPSVLISRQGPNLRFRHGVGSCAKSKVSSAAREKWRLNVVTRQTTSRNSPRGVCWRWNHNAVSQPCPLHVLWFISITVYFRANCRGKNEGWGSGANSETFKLYEIMLSLPKVRADRMVHTFNLSLTWYIHTWRAFLHIKGIFLNNSSLVITKHPENQNLLLCNFTYGNPECAIISNRIKSCSIKDLLFSKLRPKTILLTSLYSY